MCIFALSRTTLRFLRGRRHALWIASKCVSLHYHVQPVGAHFYTEVGCELLQNVYLCIITYNLSCNLYAWICVVNCFKMCIFALSRTTTEVAYEESRPLWIASKCVSLHYHVQLKVYSNVTTTSCELLQNVYLCIITYNNSICIIWCVIVVNCFKMCIFALSRTTPVDTIKTRLQLWIASKCVSLHYHVQLV